MSVLRAEGLMANFAIETVEVLPQPLQGNAPDQAYGACHVRSSAHGDHQSDCPSVLDRYRADAATEISCCRATTI